MSGQKQGTDQDTTACTQGEPATEFFAEKDAPPELVSALMRLSPANPFCTKSHADAMREYGHEPWLLGIKRRGQLVAGCYGCRFSGRLNRGFRIISLPKAACEDIFWDGLMRFCSLHKIACLEVNTFNSLGAHIPRLPGEVERLEGIEYVLDLEDPDWERKVAKKHRYSIRMALRAGVTLRRATDADSCREHVRLMAATQERRRKRGESISGNLKQELLYSTCLLEKGGGELFQAVVGGETVSSYLLLRAVEGAFGITAGTSPEGMTCGASHFLIYSVARTLREESMRVFNLGGVESNPGLGLFKSRFGAAPVVFESTSFYLGNNFRRRVTDTARFVRRTGTRLLGRIGGVSDP
jgi:hypothetical protein